MKSSVAERLSRDQSKDMARDYAAKEQEQRAHKAEPALQPPASTEQTERKQGRFAGLPLNVPSFARPPVHDQQA